MSWDLEVLSTAQGWALQNMKNILLFSYFNRPVSRKGAVGKSWTKDRCSHGKGAGKGAEPRLHPQLVIQNLHGNQQRFQPLCANII